MLVSEPRSLILNHSMEFYSIIASFLTMIIGLRWSSGRAIPQHNFFATLLSDDDRQVPMVVGVVESLVKWTSYGEALN